MFVDLGGKKQNCVVANENGKYIGDIIEISSGKNFCLTWKNQRQGDYDNGELIGMNFVKKKRHENNCTLIKKFHIVL